LLFSSVIDSVDWSWPGDPVALSDSQIDIWRTWLDVDPQETNRLFSFLTEEERSRAGRFIFPRDRDHFAVARGTLRELLGAYLQTSPASLRFQTGLYGKPSLVDHPHVRFNLSHSYGLALYVFANNRDLGIDVEKIRPEFATEGIAERYFSLAERHELRALPEEMRTEAFFLCWTRKEAYVKAHGDGLQMPLDSFDVSLTPEEPERLRSMDSERWSMRSIRPARSYLASIVAEGQIPSLRFWNAGPSAGDALPTGR
jgi:4'-phosphopantetheinyl transferase